MQFGKLIIEAGEKYQASKVLRVQALTAMKNKNVRFADIENYLFNQLKAEGYWTTEEDKEKAKIGDAAWYHHTVLFIQWVNRNYKAGYKERTKREKGSKKPQGETKTKTRVMTIKNIETASKIISNEKSLEIIIEALKTAGYTVSKND